MAIHRLQGPDGKIHRLEAPPETPPEQLVAFLTEQLQQQPQQPQPTPPQEQVDSGFFRQAADIPVSLAQGVTTGARLIADVFGADSAVSQNLRGVEDYLGGLMSAQAKQDKEEIARIMQAAQDEGVAGQLKAGIEALAVAPIDTITNALGTSAPVILSGLLAGPLAALGLGTTMGVGTVKSSIYDAVYQQMLQSGANEDQATAVASEAQSYGGDNIDQMLLGGALGAIASRTGLESSIIRGSVLRALGKQTAAETVETAARQAASREVGETAGRSMLAQAARTGAVETGTEAMQAGQEQLAANLASQRVGFDVPTMRGVVSSATLEGLAGLGLGAPAGALEVKTARDALASIMQPPGADVIEEDDLVRVANELGDTEAAERFRQRAEEASAAEEATEEEEATTAPPPADEMTDEQIAERMREAEMDREAAAQAAAEEEVVPDTGVEEPVVPEPVVEPTPTPEAPPETTVEPETTTPITSALDEATQTTLRDIGYNAEEIAQFTPEQAEQEIRNYEQAVATQDQDNAEEPAPTPAPRTADFSVDSRNRTSADPQTGVFNIFNSNEEVIGRVDQQEGEWVAFNNAGEEVARAESLSKVRSKLKGTTGAGRRATVVDPEQAAQNKITRNAKAAANKRAVDSMERAAKVINPTMGEWVTALGAEEVSLEEFSNYKNNPNRVDPERRSVLAKFDQAINQVTEFRRNALANAARVLKEDPKARNKPAQAAKQILEHSSVTAEERATAIADAKKNPALVRSSRPQNAADANPDKRFLGFKTALQAIGHIVNTGNKFERALAARLRPFLKGVSIVIVNDVNTDLPAGDVRDAFTGDGGAGNAAGLYTNVDGNRVIYLNNIPGEEGIDNLTVLHEALHAATVQAIIDYYEGKPLTADQKQIIAAIELVRSNAVERIADRINAGTATDEELWLFDRGAFTDPREFITYGLTNEYMQEFLLHTDGVVNLESKGKQSLLTQFVTLVRKLFGLGGDHQSAFQDLFVLTDQLLKATSETIPESAVLAAARKKNKQQKIQAKIDRGRAGTSMPNGVGEAFVQSRSVEEGVGVLRTTTPILSRSAIKTILPLLSTTDIVRWMGDKIKNLRNIQAEEENMQAWRNQAMRGVLEFGDKWAAWAKQNVKSQELMSNAAYAATLLHIDPLEHPDAATAIANDAELAALNNDLASAAPSSKPAIKGQITTRTKDIEFVYKAFEAFKTSAGTKGVEIFRSLRDKYTASLDDYIDTLKDKVAASQLAVADQQRLLAKINADYMEAKKLGIYFPLVRYGNYWLRVGKGKSGDFYMFESEIARDLYANNLAKQRGTTVDALMVAEDIDLGNDARGLRAKMESSGATGQMLKSVYDLIDNKGGTANTTDELKDAVYQLYLYTLPSASVRRRFIKRQGKGGFNTDLLRNFYSVQTSNINQLARLKYNDKIQRAIESAEAELTGGDTAKLKLQLFIEEMKKRYELSSSQNPDDIIRTLASLGNKAVFYWMMTAPKSALVQMTQLPIVGLPVLAQKYGWAKTLAMTGRYTNLFNKLSTSRLDQNGDVITKWGAPSIQNSGYINNSPNKKVLSRAWEQLNNRGLFMNTYTSDTTERGKQPSGVQDNLLSLSALGRFMSGAFHHTERIAREIMGMSSFELAYDKARAAGATEDAAYDLAIKEAEEATYEGLFNYSESNKPRLMRYPAAKLGTQFLTYPLQMTSYLVRNFYGMFRATPGKSKMDSAKMFFGTMMMTGMFAGLTRLPMYSVIAGMIDGYRELMRPDPDDDDWDPTYDQDTPDNPFGMRSIDMWFRYSFIPKYFGPGSDIANAFGLSDAQAQTLARGIELGPISAFLDMDIGSSVGLDGLWLRDDTPSENAQSAVNELGTKLLGPFGSMAANFGKAADYFEKGDVSRGFESMLPAMFRGAATAIRKGTEGAETPQGYKMLDAEFYHTGKLLAQTLGFVSTTESQIQKANITAKRMVVEAEREKAKVLDRLNRAFQDVEKNPLDSAASDRFAEVLKEATDFNYRNPFDPITGDTVRNSIRGRVKDRLLANYGLSIGDRYKAVIYPMIESTRPIKD